MIKRPKPERFRLRRTMMFMNAQKPGLIKDAYIYGCDSIMLDLEDAVAENQKDAARFSLYHALTTIDYGSTEVIVRINGLDTPHWQEDIRVCVAGGADGIRIAKCESAQDVKTVEEHVAAAEREFGVEVGRTLLGARADDVACRARARAAAGSDARMNGCALPVAIVCGSGNQGITCALPVMEYAEYLRCDHERLVRAVMLSDLIAVHIKSYIGALSAFCGAICAACGAGAAITWLCGGTREQIGATVSNTLGNVGGIVCDGAKASCAAKISAAVDAAILGHDMAMQGRGFRAGEGLIQDTVEQTIASMGYVGRVGMKDTDVEILNIMIGKTQVC